jgi:hypothetical protein
VKQESPAFRRGEVQSCSIGYWGQNAYVPGYAPQQDGVALVLYPKLTFECVFCQPIRANPEGSGSPAAGSTMQFVSQSSGCCRSQSVPVERAAMVQLTERDRSPSSRAGDEFKRLLAAKGVSS